jgi:hypothetical protein
MGTSVPVLEARSCAQDDERKHVLRFTADSNGLSKLPLFVRSDHALNSRLAVGRAACVREPWSVGGNRAFVVSRATLRRAEKDVEKDEALRGEDPLPHRRRRHLGPMGHLVGPLPERAAPPSRAARVRVSALQRVAPHVAVQAATMSDAYTGRPASGSAGERRPGDCSRDKRFGRKAAVLSSSRAVCPRGGQGTEAPPTLGAL